MGLWPSVLRETLVVRDGLMKEAPVASMFRRMEFLLAAQGKAGLEFTPAESLACLGRSVTRGIRDTA